MTARDRDLLSHAVRVGVVSGVVALFAVMFLTMPDFSDPRPDHRFSPGLCVLAAFLVGPVAGIAVVARGRAVRR